MKAEVILSTQCACLDEKGNAWFFANEMNALFYRNLTDGITEYITSFDKEEILAGQLYTDAVWFRGKIFLVPCAAKDIAIYDTVKKTTAYINLCTSPDNYNVVRLPEEHLLLYSVRHEPSAYIVSLEEECCEYIPVSYGKEVFKEGVLLRGTAYWNGNAYFVIDRTNRCVVFNIESKSVQISSMEKETALFSAASDGQYLYMLHANGCAYDAYDENGYVKTYELANTPGHADSEMRFEDMEYVINTVLEDGSVVSIPMRKQQVMVMRGGVIHRFPLDEEKIGSYINDLQPLYICKSCKNKIVLFPYHGTVLVVIDLETGKTAYLSAEIDITKYSRWFENIMGKLREQKILYEGKSFLNIFLIFIQEQCQLKSNGRYKNIGAKIFEHLMRDI